LAQYPKVFSKICEVDFKGGPTSPRGFNLSLLKGWEAFWLFSTLGHKFEGVANAAAVSSIDA